MINPANPFVITAAASSVALDSSRKAVTAFTVSNSLGRAVTARARVQYDKPDAAAWITLTGDAEVPFAVSQSHQYNIEIVVPPDAAPGAYSFRLDVVGVENPDEMASQGPSVSVEVPAPVAAAKGGLPSWWWIPVAAIVALLVGGVLAFVLLRGGGDEEPSAPARPQIRIGSTGPAVVELQNRLQELGFMLEADGMFGPVTQQRVRTFQQVNGLQVDGIVGPETWAALDAAEP